MKEKDKEAIQELNEFLTDLYKEVHQDPEPETVNFDVERNKVLKFKRTLYKFIEYYNQMYNKLQLFVEKVLGADMSDFNDLFDDIVEGDITSDEIEERLLEMTSKKNRNKYEQSLTFVDLTEGENDPQELNNHIEGFRMMAAEQGGLN
jgi:hypothetical protein